ncbi:hypothetical protein J0B03_08475 [Alkalibacter rhizosphaerae]|uniref:Uncharacterized protein n=1 Tax=Alkalibacter rhizosphaerae TaxID=2815577 RepID=A0A974XDJ3_9FIRM|nr:hypothetical protein [Alkalibacter rhizosphaerae]QSX07844.1 hypothetical protein J0B03_08475 [Alkalibacter rhizosphaerae]
MFGFGSLFVVVFYLVLSLIPLAILYFIIKLAVKNAIRETREEERLR